jgi:glycosyltransferase involved in cell wall biosynthesis
VALVSVVIPCHRCGDTIARALDSVRRQSAPVQETLLVDDASGDGTVDRLHALAKEFPGTRVLALAQNGGPATARNAGWAAAQGKYVAFLDADDAWHPRKIELQQALMERRPELALSGHAHLELRTGESPPAGEPPEAVTEIRRGALLRSNRFTTSSIMLRRDLPQRFRDGQRHMEDHLLWLSLVCAGERAARLDAALSYRYAAAFGDAGLSADLLAMERAELANYFRLYRSGAIGTLALAGLLPWSLAKFARRVAITCTRSRA